MNQANYGRSRELLIILSEVHYADFGLLLLDIGVNHNIVRFLETRINSSEIMEWPQTSLAEIATEEGGWGSHFKYTLNM